LAAGRAARGRAIQSCLNFNDKSLNDVRGTAGLLAELLRFALRMRITLELEATAAQDEIAAPLTQQRAKLTQRDLINDASLPPVAAVRRGSLLQSRLAKARL